MTISIIFNKLFYLIIIYLLFLINYLIFMVLRKYVLTTIKLLFFQKIHKITNENAPQEEKSYSDIFSKCYI